MSTSRQWFCAIIVLLVGISAHCTAGDERNKAEKSDMPALILEKPLVVPDKADEVTRLLIERRNAAVELLQANFALYAGGKGGLEPAVLAAERLLAAQMEVSGSNKIQILEQHVAFARELNKIVDARYDTGVADAATHRLAKWLRLEMELRLAREKIGTKKNAT